MTCIEEAKQELHDQARPEVTPIHGAEAANADNEAREIAELAK